MQEILYSLETVEVVSVLSRLKFDIQKKHRMLVKSNLLNSFWIWIFYVYGFKSKLIFDCLYLDQTMLYINFAYLLSHALASNKAKDH